VSSLRYLHGAAALLAVVIVAGCGDGTSAGAVARVGDTAITNAALDHWTAVLMGGRVSSAADVGKSKPLRQRALQLLISSQWLAYEAADRRVTPSEREVKERVGEHERKAFPGGQDEVHEFLEASGQTVADMELEARAELTSTRLHARVTAGVHAVTYTQISAYYREHRQAFLRPEVRVVGRTNRKSVAAAERLIREVRYGASFAERFEPQAIERPNSVTAQSASGPLAKAIYAAKLDVLTGPVKQGVDYWVFEVKRTRPPTQESLQRASAAIRQQLLATSLQRALAEAVAAWRARWTARTSCSPGYVVQKCRQYHGPLAPEDPLDFN
jgi:hypothetical protein